MSKDRKINIVVLGFFLLISGALYVFTEFFCTGNCYVTQEIKYYEPLFIGSLGLIPTVLVLLAIGDAFVSWVKYIAWWYLLVTIGFVSSISPYTSGVLTFDRRETTIFLMTILFIITLIYTLVMKRKVKDSLQV